MVNPNPSKAIALDFLLDNIVIFFTPKSDRICAPTPYSLIFVLILGFVFSNGLSLATLN